MPVTPEQRSMHDLCGAKKKNGELCRAYAGQGTDHPGVGRCKFHLGNAPNLKKHAAKQQEADRRVRRSDPDRPKPSSARDALPCSASASSSSQLSPTTCWWTRGQTGPLRSPAKKFATPDRN